MSDTSDPGIDVPPAFAEAIRAMVGGYGFLGNRLSDTEVVVSATSLIDQHLRFALLLRFAPASASRTMIAEVFDGNGALATFAAKISVCAALGILNDEMRHDLRIIRKVRNQFAHTAISPALGDMKSCKNLKLRSNLIKHRIKGRTLERRRFIHSSAAIVTMLTIRSIVSLGQHKVIQDHQNEVLAAANDMLGQIYPALADAEL